MSSAAASAASNTMSRLITTPTRIARALDWQKLSSSVLSVHVGENSIDLAVTFHPSSGNDIQALPSIPIELETRNNSKVLKTSVLQELSAAVETWNACGLVVSWPVQREGWCGKPCGRTLHFLDQIAQDTNIVNPKRPLALWDGHHFYNTEDSWGRSSIYATTSDRPVHVASKEQYQDEGMLAADIAADYLRFHFPDLVHNLQVRSSTNISSFDRDSGTLESSERLKSVHTLQSS